MSDSFRSPAGRVRGLGSAKEGTTHFIRQRVSALALLVLVPWFLISGVMAIQGGHAGLVEWIASPINAALLILTLGAAFYHMRLGMQVVIEDYIAKSGTKHLLLILNTFIAVALFVITAMSVLKLWIGG